MSSHRSSGGALNGGENAVSWAKSGKGHPSGNNVNANLVNHNNNSTVNATGTTIIDTALPIAAVLTPQINVDVVGAVVETTSAKVSKPLTIANLAALPSSFTSSVISTTPTSEDESSSELSYSTSSSSEVPSVASSVDEAKFLSSIFGSTYLSEFSKHGVKLISLPADVAEDLPCASSETAAGSAVVLSSPAHDTKTLYYLAPSDPTKLDRESLVDLMEVAEEDLECNGIVICLDRKNTSDKEELAETLHSLMYVGGSIVAPDAGMLGFNSEDYILVGLDL